MLFARIQGTKPQLRLLAQSPIHVHRRGARKIGEDRFEVPAVLRQADADLLVAEGYQVSVDGDVKQLLSQRLAPAHSRVTSFNSPEDLFNSVATNGGYMDTGYIENWTVNLASLFPEFCTRLQLPNQTWQGRVTSAIRLRAGDAGGRLSVLFTSGMHAAELGGPDSSIYFLYRLISAYQAKAPITLGKKTFNEEHVQDMVNHLDIYVAPCVNPDGRAYVQTTRDWWRKNYRPGAGTTGIGVDINRNFDFLWASGIGSSIRPGDDTYRGPAALSEPETRNVQWLLNTAEPDYFMDIHGPSGALVYVWGDAPDQSVDPTMSFLNPGWDGKRIDPYQEYLSAGDAALLRQLGSRIIDAVNSVGSGGYELQQSFDDLYPTTASSDDYAYSGHLADASKHKTCAYTFEYGGDDFFPPYPDMVKIIGEVDAAMLALCDAVVVPTS